MPVESRDDLVKEVFRPDGILPVNVWTIAALAEEVRRLTTRIESDAKRIAELEAERDRIGRNRDMWKGQCERQATALAEERERCAAIAETFSPIGKLKHRGTCLGIATAIRSGKPDGKE